MDEEYRLYYQRIYETLADFPDAADLGARRPRDYAQARRMVRDVVSEVSDSLDAGDLPDLREDAKLLLFLNAWQMIVRPILEVRGVDPEEIVVDLRQDLYLVVGQAASEVEADPDGEPLDEITGHGVIDALSRLWGELRVTRWQVWE